MANKYYITVNKTEEELSLKYDHITTRKTDYIKYAKQAIKNGAVSVDIYASVKNECDNAEYLSYIKTFYPEDFKIHKP